MVRNVLSVVFSFAPTSVGEERAGMPFSPSTPASSLEAIGTTRSPALGLMIVQDVMVRKNRVTKESVLTCEPGILPAYEYVLLLSIGHICLKYLTHCSSSDSSCDIIEWDFYYPGSDNGGINKSGTDAWNDRISSFKCFQTAC